MLVMDKQVAMQLPQFTTLLTSHQYRVRLFFLLLTATPNNISIFLCLDQPIPHTASCALGESSNEAYFALANQTNVMLYTMNCSSGHVSSIELKESGMVPRILTNLTGAFR